MALNLYGRNYDDITTQTIDEKTDINAFSRNVFDTNAEYMTVPPTSKFDQLVANLNNSKQVVQPIQEAPKVDSEMSAVHDDLFLQDKPFKTVENNKQKLAIFRLKLAVCLYLMIASSLFGFLIYNFVAINNLSRQIDINKVKIEIKEDQLERENDNFYYNAETNEVILNS